MKFRNLICSFVAITAVFCFTFAHAGDLNKGIFVTNAWVQAMPPSQTTSAAYMVITNNASKEAVLVSASSDIAGAVEIHQMSDVNGMMKMAMLPDLHIPALGKITLSPGGYHLMLINLKKSVNKGDTVPITLHFQDASIVEVNAQVRLSENEETGNIAADKMQAVGNSSGMAGMKM